MAVPTIAATSAVGFTSDLHTVTVPAHSVGDITLIFAFNRNSGSTPTLSWENSTFPFLSGATFSHQFDILGFQGNLLVIGKRESGTSSYTVNLEQENSISADLVGGVAICISGVASDVPIDSTLFKDEDGGNSTDISLSNISVNCDTRDTLALLFVATVDDRDMLDCTGETGGNWTNHTDGLSTVGSDGAMGIYKADMSGGGTISGGTIDISGASVGWGVIALAIPAIVAVSSIGRSLETSWDVTGTVGRSLETLWDIGGEVGRSLEAIWHTFSGVEQWPDTILHIDWDGDGFDGEIDDRTADFRSISWARGADKAGPGRVGTATILVDDQQGKYVDTNEDSPLFGHLNPGARVWVTAHWEGIVVGIFSGYIDEIVPLPNEYSAQIICSDLLKRASEIEVRPPNDLVTVRDLREWALEQLDIPSNEWDLSLSEGQTLHRVPGKGTVLEILEACNESVGSTHVVIPGITSSTWQQYTVIDRHHGITVVTPPVNANGDSAVKREGFSGWRTSIENVINRVLVSGTPPPDNFDEEVTDVWESNDMVHFTDETVVWADLTQPAIDLEVSAESPDSGVAAAIEEVGWDTAKIVLTYPGETVVTRIVISGRAGNRPGQVSHQVDNESSQDAYGIREGRSISSDLVGVSIANGAAEHVVYAGGEPRKEPSVLLKETFSEIVEGDIGVITSVTLAKLFVTDRRMRIEGIDGEIDSPVVWSILWKMIDEQEAVPDLFILDVSELDTGVLGR